MRNLPTIQITAAIHIGDLGEFIAIKEGNPMYEWYQRILVDLHHSHLPHVTNAGVVRYDEQTERVKLAVDRKTMAPYLAIIEHAE
ncbi:DUF7344 domain-containing protein [Halomontanus rarus]|uniref:DUF7344 domain-containing protein n=1 Tax=Halomontanus rarus TaxID=3034020 RepID=UPI003CE4C6C5